MRRTIEGRVAGPYSPGVVAGGFCFVAGQIGVGGDGTLPSGIEAQTRNALDNVKGVLERAGLALHHVVRTTVYLTDIADFQTMNGVYADYFETEPPARVTIAVAALPLGAVVEIDAIASEDV
jgi:2-iminobutanoate/2-iminopropanoate deaminase